MTLKLKKSYSVLWIFQHFLYFVAKGSHIKHLLCWFIVLMNRQKQNSKPIILEIPPRVRPKDDAADETSARPHGACPCGIVKWQCWDFFLWLSPRRHSAMSPTKSCFSRQCSTITNSVSSSSGFFISRLKNIRIQCEAIYHIMINNVCLLKSFSCLSLKQLLFLYILNDLSWNDTTT